MVFPGLYYRERICLVMVLRGGGGGGGGGYEADVFYNCVSLQQNSRGYHTAM